MPETAKCYAGRIIEENPGNKKVSTLGKTLRVFGVKNFDRLAGARLMLLRRSNVMKIVEVTDFFTANGCECNETKY